MEDEPLYKKELLNKASYKFVERKLAAPRFQNHVHITSYRKIVGDRCSEYMEGIGNIERVWHGTSLTSLSAIGTDGLKLGRWGLFGGGIYLAPSEAKAMNHAKGSTSHRDYRALLKCYVARGKVYRAEESQDYRKYLIQHGYDSVEGTGMVGGAWGGRLAQTEYVVYDIELVEVSEIHIYKSYNRYGHWRYTPTKSINPSVFKHPCKVNNKVCKNAYNASGCMQKNKKKGCTKEDFKYCDFYEK